MFTGLIEEVGRTQRVERTGNGARLVITASLPAGEIALGDSVAVNGVCLTVVSKETGLFSFDVSPETMSRSSFRNLRPGSPVNLERALRVGDRLGGHLVSGHIDCVAVVSQLQVVSGNTILTFRMPDRYLRYLIEKGSVAIDGISLTVNEVSSEGFSVNIIPHTLANTTLSLCGVGDEVNIETDLIGKYVERLLGDRESPEKQGVSLELLAKSGFL